MNRKDLTREYKEAARPMGIFQVRNTITGRILLGSSVDLPARLNRERAQLSLRSHANKQLQADWSTYGEAAFEFTTLDTLTPPADDPSYDPRSDLQALEQMWLDSLAPYGERGYHTDKRSAPSA